MWYDGVYTINKAEMWQFSLIRANGRKSGKKIRFNSTEAKTKK
jgi:hypothetical protein